MDGQALREMMRHVPSPVTVVTAAGAGEIRGITIGSFTSVSLDPPLISFNVHREAQMHPVLEAASHFAVHILQEDQGHLSNHFALPDLTPEEQFDRVPYRLSPQGTPLEDATLIFQCVPQACHEAGDHSIIVAEVVAIEQVREGSDPLVYFNRSYRRVGGEVRVSLFSPVKRASSGTS